MADQLSSEGASKLKLQPITTVDGKPMRATAVVRRAVSIRERAGTKRSNTINFVIANITHYDMILGMALLHKQNLDS
jgi:hypothetical protein